ncbi:hypothetical protein AVEN_158598-1 [Araneus ventricosus]|uniref:STPR domain-containing protein n=1 Tax=Araneus ventricosus TaxID=182803 RepID=A0A4Y2JM21_ARAVE|nr:hypothetical protein AVEN_158598-1 [Araneus ventricosus]
MSRVNKLWIEGYVFTLSEEKYPYSIIQKHFEMHGVKISKCKISNIINRKEKNHQSLLLHGKKTPSEYPKKLIFGSYHFCFVQFSLFPTPKRKRGITGDAASRREAIRKRERRVVETEEERSRRLPTIAQRGQDRRAEETEQRNSRLAVMGQRSRQRRAEGTNEQRNSRLSAMLQHARERRLNVIEGQNHHQIQTFYTARTVLN